MTKSYAYFQTAETIEEAYVSVDSLTLTEEAKKAIEQESAGTGESKENLEDYLYNRLCWKAAK